MNKGKFQWILLFIVLPLFFFSGADQRVEVYNLRSHTHPFFTRIVIDIGKLREYTFNRLTNPDRVYIDIFQAKLNPILHGKTIPVNSDYLRQIRIAQKTTSTVRAVVDIDFGKVKKYQVFHLLDPFRVVIDIYPEKSTEEKATEKIPAPPQPTESGYSMIRQLGLGVRRVVIDPGHGGADPGSISRTGLKEKDVVLKVCLYLKQLLSSRKDLEVTLTRESDIFIPLENRTIIANQKKADIFISIHANAHKNKRLSGVETFFLNFSQNPKINEIAAKENATSTKNISEMMDIIKKIVRNSKIVESRELAKKIQKSLVNQLSKSYKNVKNLGVRGGPFWVLIGGETPSVLVEISYLSNYREETRLKSPQYLQKVAQGIYEGIVEYMHSLGKG